MIEVNRYRVEIIKSNGAKEAHMSPTIDKAEDIAKDTRDMYSYKVVRKRDNWTCVTYTKFSSAVYNMESEKDKSDRIHGNNPNLKIEAPIKGMAV